MSGKFLKLGVLGLSLFGLINSFLILLHFQGLNSQNFILSEKLKKADVDFNYDLARLYFNDGNLERAKIYFVDSLNANPLYTKSIVDLSEIYLDQDNYEQAEVLLRRAHFLSPYAFKLIWRMAILSLWIDQKEFALDLLNTISRIKTILRII
jgi:tetratricopeptide (TPR) repeat protein